MTSNRTDDDGARRPQKPGEEVRLAGLRWIRIAIPAAAGLLLLALAPRAFDSLRGARGAKDAPRPARSETTTIAPAPNDPTARPDPSTTAPSSSAASIHALFPLGSFTEPPPRFQWSSAEGVTSYRIDVADESGSAHFSRATSETTLAWPAAELDPFAGRILVWRVTPLRAGTAGPASEPVRIRVELPSGAPR